MVPKYQMLRGSSCTSGKPKKALQVAEYEAIRIKQMHTCICRWRSVRASKYHQQVYEPTTEVALLRKGQANAQHLPIETYVPQTIVDWCQAQNPVSHASRSLTSTLDGHVACLCLTHIQVHFWNVHSRHP